MADMIDRKAAIGAVFESTVGRRMLTGHKDLITILKSLPPALPEITDEQAIEHLQATGWMQNHDHEMYMMGRRDALGDDSGSYDALIPAEQKFGKWIVMDDDRISGRCSVCGWEAHMYEDDVVGMNCCPNCGAKMEEQDGNA